jgi:hypothetical protein
MRRLTTITAAATLLVVTGALAAHAGGGMGSMGRSGSSMRPAFHGFYDGHKDTFLNTDVSDKAQAAQMHINYAPALKKVPMSATEEIYLVEGRAAAGQIPVFSAEPGEAKYTPLWHEVMVTWKATATPVLLTKDDQIEQLAKQGQLTTRDTMIVLNCPIVHPTKATIGATS